MLFREIDTIEFTQRTSEPELKEDESIDHLKFLVENFRNLALNKDAVIIQYREILEKFKDSASLAEQYQRRIVSQNYLLAEKNQTIVRLESEIKELKKLRNPKKVKKDE